jgi:DNA-binding CsgD family transcriptional regulator
MRAIFSLPMLRFLVAKASFCGKISLRRTKSMRNEGRAVHNGAADVAFLSPAKPNAVTVDPRERLGSLTKAAGFTHFLFANFPCGDCSGFSGNHLLSNWPDALVADYDEGDLFHNSALVSELRRSSLPVSLDVAAFESNNNSLKSARITAMFRGLGVKRTFAFVLHDGDRRPYIFAFSGGRSALSREEAMEQVFGAMEFLDAYARSQVTEQPLESLSNREIECLRWSAAGKSSDEIAIILDLSPHTVVGYLKSAMRKLDSVNRMQAVARAFRYRLL